MESLAVQTEELPELKCRLRNLVRFFRDSRDQWKTKYQALQTDIKRYKNQAGDARRSREKWRTKAEFLDAQVQQLIAERDHWEQAAKQKPHSL